MKFHLIILFFVISTSYSLAQSSKREAAPETKRAAGEIDRGATYAVETKKVKKRKKKYSLSNSFEQKVEEYEQRMKANAKKYAKLEKEMKKPQYSDPTYFGHKKKPKKRPPGKKKFCKECQMYH